MGARHGQLSTDPFLPHIINYFSYHFARCDRLMTHPTAQQIHEVTEAEQIPCLLPCLREGYPTSAGTPRATFIPAYRLTSGLVINKGNILKHHSNFCNCYSYTSITPYVFMAWCLNVPGTTLFTTTVRFTYPLVSFSNANIYSLSYSLQRLIWLPGLVSTSK
jgi:hypothetical protein